MSVYTFLHFYTSLCTTSFYLRLYLLVTSISPLFPSPTYPVKSTPITTLHHFIQLTPEYHTISHLTCRTYAVIITCSMSSFILIILYDILFTSNTILTYFFWDYPYTASLLTHTIEFESTFKALGLTLLSPGLVYFLCFPPSCQPTPPSPVIMLTFKVPTLTSILLHFLLSWCLLSCLPLLLLPTVA